MMAECNECEGKGRRNYAYDGQMYYNRLCEGCGGAGEVELCDVCGGSGLRNTETGAPESNATAHRSDVDQCLACDGYGTVAE